MLREWWEKVGRVPSPDVAQSTSVEHIAIRVEVAKGPLKRDLAQLVQAERKRRKRAEEDRARPGEVAPEGRAHTAALEDRARAPEDRAPGPSEDARKSEGPRQKESRRAHTRSSLGPHQKV